MKKMYYIIVAVILILAIIIIISNQEDETNNTPKKPGPDLIIEDVKQFRSGGVDLLEIKIKNIGTEPFSEEFYLQNDLSHSRLNSENEAIQVNEIFTVERPLTFRPGAKSITFRVNSGIDRPIDAGDIQPGFESNYDNNEFVFRI